MKTKIEVDVKGRKSVVDVCTEPCAIEKGMRILGSKWKGSIIYHLKDGPVRFNDLTEFGHSALTILDELRKWSESNNVQLK
ncbi:winged helix-turn-helix transcriptional regulator [Vibrio alfacsensis]|uniref:winged helix-turn-helix transcriptional regulator n=1 Tax=Vibrio alfacsensis TaxID=1074311 RepID=UPI0040692BC5